MTKKDENVICFKRKFVEDSIPELEHIIKKGVANKDASGVLAAFKEALKVMKAENLSEVCIDNNAKIVSKKMM
jgi:hypothetical protein